MYSFDISQEFNRSHFCCFSVPQLFSPEFGSFEESVHDLVYTNTSESDDDKEEKEEHHFKVIVLLPNWL